MFLFTISNAFPKAGKITLSGSILNPTQATVEITYINDDELVSAELDSEGNFSLTAKIESGFYFLNYGRNSAYIYLHPKDDLKIRFNSEKFIESMVFEGKGADRNNFLVKKSMVDKELTKDINAFYKVNEATYLDNLDTVKKTHLENLKDYSVETFFEDEIKISLEYEQLLDIQNYASNYKFYIGDEITPSKDFFKPIESLDLYNPSHYKYQPYYRYLVNSIWGKRIEAETNVDDMLDVLREVKSKEVIISLLNSFYTKIGTRKERSKDYLDLIKRITTYEPFIEAAEKRYQEVSAFKSLVKGSISPKFSYESIEGNTVHLDDFKGKYVYIDIWATWCAPCIKQVPYLKKLEETYQDKDIVFVSISVDKESSKPIWKQMVFEKALGGIQLFADQSFDSDFMEAYSVNSIPRFILIDPEGKIIDVEAPRPSFDKTKQLLDELLR